MTETILIHSGRIVTMDDDVPDLPNGSVLIEDGRISAVAAEIEPPPGAALIDAAGMIVHPGLVDTHKHMWQTALRGVVGDRTLVGYFSDVRRDYLSRYRAEDAYVGTYAGALELIAGGTTAVLDHSHGVVTPEHADALAQAELASGIRGVWAYGYCPVDVDGPPAFGSHADRVKDAQRVREEFFADSRARLRMGVAITEQNLLPFDCTEAEIRSALAMDVVWTAHTHCGPGNAPITRGFHRLVGQSLVDHRAVLSHCNEFRVDDFDVVRELGAHFASSPDSEIALGIARPTPYRDALLAGVSPSLGTDCVTCMSGDMYSAMRVALMFARHQINDGPGRNYETIVEQPVSTRDVFRWATVEGAKALGLQREIGSLTPGKRADVVCVDARAINLAPVLDPVADLVLHAHAGNVDTVVLDGVIRKRHGQLLDVDVPKLVGELERSRDYLMTRAGQMAGSAELVDEAAQWSDTLTRLQ
ncbi:amidohydrolase family protein [Amycolatopsis mongoliensis]|uniref:Amidohydrolase family protein n=1 Tax=Amycolatopsis mongoliensis TaxID=715475 RepID=A0A9Y2JPD8_9PSEU|nr:amidohydrolase family protein [Amycolatopsis sp. 4-36]WIY01087.1 amidohydrolase family protein [Amycolatopsis sp. 4-36]